MNWSFLKSSHSYRESNQVCFPNCWPLRCQSHVGFCPLSFSFYYCDHPVWNKIQGFCSSSRMQQTWLVEQPCFHIHIKVLRDSTEEKLVFESFLERSKKDFFFLLDLWRPLRLVYGIFLFFLFLSLCFLVRGCTCTSVWNHRVCECSTVALNCQDVSLRLLPLPSLSVL